MQRLLSILILISLVGSGCASRQSEPAPAPPAPPAPPPAPVMVETAPATPHEELIGKIDAVFNDERFAHAFWGVKIKSLATGEVWYERNAGKLFMPASNQKIPTTAAALLVLGPEWRFTTDFTVTGPVEDGVVQGDLVVFGNGDPTLYTRFFDTPLDVFYDVASALKRQGITRINGRVIGDDNAWDDQHIGFGWPLSGLSSWYSAEFGPLQLNENYIDITVIPPETADGEVSLRPNIQSSYFELVNNIEVREGGRAANAVSVTREHGTNRIVFRGYVRAGSDPFERSPSLTNPTAFYAYVLRETLVAEGLIVDGPAVDCDDIDGWSHTAEDFTLVHRHESPALLEILQGLMKRSQNMYAETMVHTLGWNETGHGSFGAGRSVIQGALEPFGLEQGAFRFADGSGLTRYNYISPDQIVGILEGMRRHELWEAWYSTFPIAGVDGTLRSRMGGTAAEGNARGKTGTISQVRGLSGYVTTAAGEEVAYSFLVNSHMRSTRETEEITDSVLELIAEYGK